MDAILEIFANLFGDADMDAILGNLSGVFGDFDTSVITDMAGSFGDIFGGFSF